MAAVRRPELHGVYHYITLIERQANNLQQQPRRVGADGEHTPRILLRIDFDDGDRVPQSVLDGFARYPVLVGGWMNTYKKDNTGKMMKPAHILGSRPTRASPLGLQVRSRR